MSFRFQVSRFKALAAVAPFIYSVNAADYQIQTLDNAHSMFRGATNAAMYAEAAQQYEYLVKEEGLRNGHLFYNVGNSWFMAGDVGRAILNYRRAELFMPNNADLQHNLKAALEMRRGSRCRYPGRSNVRNDRQI